MAADQEQKTQDPTAKRLDDARRKGQVAMAGEVRHAVMFLAMYVLLGATGVMTLDRLAVIASRVWGTAETLRIASEGGQQLASSILAELAWAIAPALVLLFSCALSIGFLQGRPTVAWARLQPKWSKLNPLAGFTRLFGKSGLVEMLKMLAKAMIVFGIAWLVLRSRTAAFVGLVGADPATIGAVAGGLFMAVLKPVLTLVLVLAAADWLYQHRAFLRRMRMTLQEVKDEHKESDGNPVIKSRQRAIGLQRARKRMMAAVPTASVIVTNPTHYAVALRYEHGAMRAPVVVAKGVDAIALRIREIATEAKVPIIENRQLARGLYASAEVDRPIPIEFYAAVAEIISHILGLAQRRAA